MIAHDHTAIPSPMHQEGGAIPHRSTTRMYENVVFANGYGLRLTPL